MLCDDGEEQGNCNNTVSVYIDVTLRRARVNYCYGGQAISVTCSECVYVALVIQHVMRILRGMLLSVECLLYRIFPTLSHKRYDFPKEKKSYRS